MDGDTKNSFAKDIIIEITNDDGSIIGVSLSNKYLPQVAIYYGDTKEGFKYKHYLPKYT